MSIYIAEELQQMKDGLTVKFLQQQEFQLTDKDHEVMKQGLEMILRVRKHKACQYVSSALFVSGKIKQGIHLYCRRMHEFSMCAESAPIERAHYKFLSGNPDPIETLATYHAAFDTAGNIIGKPYLASPCQRCQRLLKQVSPNCLIITELMDKRLVKIPLDAIPFFPHPTKHNGE